MAPASGTVSFAGTVPTNGKTVTIQTPDGYAVTLVHLGSYSVTKGAAVTEGDGVGTIGPSGVVDETVPYVYLGVRHADDSQGYVDPLTFLPDRNSLPPTGDKSDGSSSSTAAGSDPAPASDTSSVSDPTEVSVPTGVSTASVDALPAGGCNDRFRSGGDRPAERE